MKKILLLTLISAFVLSSCKDQEESMGVSYTVTYPTIKLNGDVALTIPVGGSYTEKGCMVKEGETDYSSLVKITGTVNSAVAGVYTITYTYKNAGKIYPQDSLTLKVRRYIGVITPAASTMDISGNYKRSAGVFGVASVAKTAYPGLYINNNPGGAAVDNIFIYMFHTDAAVVSAPSQDSPVGEFACINGSYNAAGVAPDFKPLYKWVCKNAGYGASVRTFNKQ